MLVTCQQCNKQFNTAPFNVAKGRGKYCSKTCYGQSKVLILPVLTDKQMSVINGILLSDGCLSRPKKVTKNSRLYVKQCAKHSEYLYVLYDLLSSYSSSIGSGQGKKIIGVKYVDGKRKLVHSDFEFEPYFRFISKSHPCFSEMRKEWYPAGTKILPNGLKLDAMTLAHWFMGDGSYSKGYRSSAYFSTDSFTVGDIDYLRHLLDNMSIKTHTCLHYGKLRIGISAKSIDNFVEIIRPFVCRCMAYKLGE